MGAIYDGCFDSHPGFTRWRAEYIVDSTGTTSGRKVECDRYRRPRVTGKNLGKPRVTQLPDCQPSAEQRHNGNYS